MVEKINQKSVKQLIAYSAAAGLGAFSAGQSAQAALTFVPAVENLFQNTGNQRTDIDWNNDGTFDHFINNGDNGVQFSNWCNDAAFPGCKGNEQGIGVTSVVFSAQTGFDDTNAANPLNPNTVRWPYSLTWQDNAYYAVGFEAGVSIDGTHKHVDTINQDGYTGFLSFLGSGGLGPHDGHTHVAPGKFLGFSFQAGADTHYGWLQMGLQTGPSGFLTSRVLRAAYESTPNLAIRTPIKGDLNMDGQVDILDLNAVLANWNTAVNDGDWALGDPAGRALVVAEAPHNAGQVGGNGLVDILDLNTVLSSWNNVALPPASTSIPEPASLVLLAAGAGALGLRRRRGA